MFLADVNECVADTHSCQRREHCVNTLGSFRCLQELSCQPGFELKDGECVGKTKCSSADAAAVTKLGRKGLPSLLLVLVCHSRVVTEKS